MKLNSRKIAWFAACVGFSVALGMLCVALGFAGNAIAEITGLKRDQRALDLLSHSPLDVLGGIAIGGSMLSTSAIWGFLAALVGPRWKRTLLQISVTTGAVVFISGPVLPWVGTYIAASVVFLIMCIYCGKRGTREQAALAARQCAACGYPRVGLTSLPTCPECGNIFNADSAAAGATTRL